MTTLPFPPPTPPPVDVGFLSAIIDHVAHPIFVKDRQYRFVLVNRALCDMVGRAREALIGRTDYDFFSKEEADFFRMKDSEMFKSASTVFIEEEPITDSAGKRHVLATTKVPLRGPDGEVSHLVGIIHDITGLKAAEEALRHANEDLERRVEERTKALAAAQHELLRKERLAVLGQLAGGLAHQIRNPLASILNAASLLRRELHDDPGSANSKALEVILEESWAANQIITDLLDYARVRQPTLRPVEVAELVDHALGPHPLPAGIRLVRSLFELPPVEVDTDQVRGALVNLVRNALEAMPRGGTLTVAARHEGGRIVVSIADTGPGIPAEVQGRLFEPLVTTKPLGLGLGLTTARALIENQGGQLACISQPGEGTRFEISLRIAERRTTDGTSC